MADGLYDLDPLTLDLQPTTAPKTRALRSRLVYGVAVAVVIGVGLLWRSDLLPLPGFLAKYGGDALWALAVFLLLGLVFRRSATVWLALGAVCFSWSIELLQLYHAHWIDVVRANRVGQLVLGGSFNGPDLIAYVVGIVLGVSAELLYLRRRQKAGQEV
jgi:glycopeptide antibiotics resistance protein